MSPIINYLQKLHAVHISPFLKQISLIKKKLMEKSMAYFNYIYSNIYVKRINPIIEQFDIKNDRMVRNVIELFAKIIKSYSQPLHSSPSKMDNLHCTKDNAVYSEYEVKANYIAYKVEYERASKLENADNKKDKESINSILDKKSFVKVKKLSEIINRDILFIFGMGIIILSILIKYIMFHDNSLLQSVEMQKILSPTPEVSKENSKANSIELNKEVSNLPPSNHQYAAAAIDKTNNIQENSMPVYVKVHSIESATLSSETAATIQHILKEGDVFNEDDTLIEFDCRVQQADLRKALAHKKLTTSAKMSAERLKTFGSISESEVVKADSEAEAASADVDKLEALVDKCIIKAPYNGSVSQAMAQIGESIKTGDPLLKIVNNDKLEFEMQIPSTWLQWLRIGTVFNAHITELNKNVIGKIYKINPEINSVSQTVKIMGIQTEATPGLLPGMSGEAVFPDQQHPNKN